MDTDPMQHPNSRYERDGNSQQDIPEEFRWEFGKILLEGRIKRPASQGGPITREALSRQIDLTPAAISAIEVGRATLAPELLRPLADALGLDRAELARAYLRSSKP